MNFFRVLSCFFVVKKFNRYRLFSEFDFFELGEVFFIDGKHFADHIADFGEREHAGGEGIVGDGLENEFRVSAEGAFDGHHFVD